MRPQEQRLPPAGRLAGIVAKPLRENVLRYQMQGGAKLVPEEVREAVSRRPDVVRRAVLKGLVRVKVETLTDNPRTYIMSGNVGLDHRWMEEIFAQAGWTPVPPNVDRAMFVWVELVQKSGFDKRVYDVQCELKNVVDDQKLLITNKWTLYEGMVEHFPEVAQQHMAATRRLVGVDHVPAGRQLICKPVGRGACAGTGITRVDSDEQLQRVKPALLNYCADYIACDYVSDLLLWNGRKFHLRMYWLVRPEYAGKPFFSKLHDTGKIMTAALPYRDEDFGNPDIHDTHVKSTPRNLFFPNDLDGVSPEQRKRLFIQMENILSCVGELLRLAHVGSYKESRYAYEVFGCDFLVTRDMCPILLEINQRIGMRSVPSDTDQDHYDAFARHYYRWVYDNAIAPTLEDHIHALGLDLPALPPPPPPVPRRTGPDPPPPTPESLAAARELARQDMLARQQAAATAAAATTAASASAPVATAPAASTDAAATEATPMDSEEPPVPSKASSTGEDDEMEEGEIRM